MTTQWCKFYGSAKGCIYGDNCYYSHANPFSVPMCRGEKAGNCPFGNFCNFRHIAYDTRPKFNETCRYFNSPSGCTRNQMCRFQHIMLPQQQPPVLSRPVRLYSIQQLSEMKLNIPRRVWRNKTSTVPTPTDENTENNIISISQFNCLAQSLCYGTTEHYRYKCDPKYLQWEHRCKRILYELVQYKTDIICLTEMDKEHFDSFFYPNLSSLHYEGIFLLKHTAKQSYHTAIQDGLGIFWNTNKVKYLNQKFECILGDLLICRQVALGVRLRLRQTNVVFDVWNTHLKAGRTNQDEHTRVKQCKILRNFMKKYSYEIPIILCGDLNFHFDQVINEQGVVVPSKAYTLLTNVATNAMDHNDDDDAKGDDEVNDDTVVFESVWNDKRNTFSVYSGWVDREVIACFDYIMIGKWIGNKDKDKQKTKSDVFAVQQVLNGLEQSEIKKFDSKLPNETYSSDHFLIAAKLTVNSS